MDVLPTPDQDLGWRLARLEDRLEGISERLGRLETSLRDAVAGEVHGATAELRRAISELGRRLVQDLPAELARHRDAIVAELRPPPSPPSPPTPPPPPPPPPPPDLIAEQMAGSAADAADGTEAAALADGAGGTEAVTVAVAGAPVAVAEGVERAETPEAAERRRASRRRRRQG
jgi:hypothetical protein